MEKRKCLECGETFNGRTDKKFCSDICRNNYNNKQNSDATAFVRNITNILRKNRRIILELIPEEKTKITGKKLTDKGFNFSYFTHTYTTKDGKVYKFCYECGYLHLEDDYYLLVKQKTE
jgi:predicted nucleic acid-binding Zn ribbon protein